jgi:uncharacterized protein YjbI with pentapeptide repeats
MANPEHIALLSRGQEAVTEWYRKHPGQHLDLASASLRNEDLSGFRLHFATLRDADLRGANLSGAKLVGADLTRANLSEANLAGASLFSANLSGAILHKAIFDGANLTGASLMEADFVGASFKKTAMTRVQLSDTASGATLDGARLTYIGLGEKPLVLSSLIPGDVLKHALEAFRRGRVNALTQFVLILRLYEGMFRAGARKSLRAISWPLARHFGNLTLLTRASYLMLVLVPILASLWPLVRSIVSKYDDVVSRAAISVVASKKHLDHTLADLPPSAPDALVSQLTKAANDLNARIASLQKVLGEASIPSPLFPRTLVALFFAALFSAFGHLIYQLRADPLVKETGRRQYVARAVSEFDSASADAPIRLDRALHVIANAAFRYPDEYHPNLTEQSGRLVWLPTESKQFAKLPPHVSLVAIARAAELEYDNSARRAPIAASSSLLLYLAGAALILWVVYTQSREILSAAGMA